MLRITIQTRQRISIRARVLLYSSAGVLCLFGLFFLLQTLGAQKDAEAFHVVNVNTSYQGNKNISTLTKDTQSIVLKSFEARPENGMVQIEWLTESEKHNDFFLIEKSTDGMHYSKLCKIKGAEDSDEERYYYWTDPKPSPGISYYRLSEEHYTIKSNHFPVASVRMEGVSPEKFSMHLVSPNPFSDKVSVVFSEETKNGALCLVNSSAKVVRCQKIQSAKKIFNMDELENIPSGSYYLCFVSGDNTVLMKKLFKE